MPSRQRAAPRIWHVASSSIRRSRRDWWMVRRSSGCTSVATTWPIRTRPRASSTYRQAISASCARRGWTSSLTAYLIKRAASLPFTLLGVSVVTFLFLRLIPGDAITARLGTSTALSVEQLARMRAYFGLDQPLYAQYATWIGSVLQGDFGFSIRSGQPVTSEIATRLPVTLELAIAAAVVALVVGTPLGLLSSLRPNSPLDLLGRGVGLIGLALPNFWLGTLAILLFARFLHWMPNTGGYVDFLADPAANLRFLIFPALTLGFGMAAVVMRTTRSAMLDVLGADYIRTAHAKGIAAVRVIERHALKNGLIVVLTILGIQVGYLLGGAVVVEEVFSLPGIGRMLLNAINQRDYALVQGGVLVIAALFVAANTLVDVVYGFLDPRIRYS